MSERPTGTVRAGSFELRVWTVCSRPTGTVFGGRRRRLAMSVAAERIDRLADLAAAAARDGDDGRAREFVRLARRIAERNRLALPRRLVRFTCDACDVYLVPGRNARTRLQDGHVVVTCACGSHARYPY